MDCNCTLCQEGENKLNKLKAVKKHVDDRETILRERIENAFEIKIIQSFLKEG